MNNYWIKLLFFLLLNFAAIGLGGLVTGDAVLGEWYQNLNKAPWTPPGWVFGAAWTTIMICFSFFMAAILDWDDKSRSMILIVYLSQLLLNYLWNPVFFSMHKTVIALVVICSLFLLVIWLYGMGAKQKGFPTVALIFPYIIWLIIAISLNAYVVLNN